MITIDASKGKTFRINFEGDKSWHAVSQGTIKRWDGSWIAVYIPALEKNLLIKPSVLQPKPAFFFRCALSGEDEFGNHQWIQAFPNPLEKI